MVQYLVRVRALNVALMRQWIVSLFNEYPTVYSNAVLKGSHFLHFILSPRLGPSKNQFGISILINMQARGRAKYELASIV